jgi:hypothetical protein
MPLSQACGEGESLTNIWLLNIREVCKQLLDGTARCQGLDDHADGYTQATDARLASHDLRVHRNAVELLHVVMIAQP